MRRLVVVVLAIAALVVPVGSAATTVVVEPPGPPTSMGLSNPTPTTIDLAWGTSVGAVAYVLAWSESGLDGRRWMSDDREYGVDRRSVRLTNLKPGRTYDVSVRGVNAAGQGPELRRSMATPEIPAPVPPVPTSTAPPAPTTTKAPAPPAPSCEPAPARVRFAVARVTPFTVRVSAHADVLDDGVWVQTADPLKLVYWRDGAWRTWRDVPAGTSAVSSTGAVIFRAQHYATCTAGYSGSSQRTVPAVPTPRRYTSCAALRVTWPAGVSGNGIAGTTWSTRTYRLNPHLDADGDGAACELQ